MISGFISTLLLKHDCVIIPGFGGFMAQPVGSSCNSERNELLPPSRKLLFNNQLVINDGLLVNYISRQQNISYSEACLQVMKWTDEIKASVHAGNRFNMEGIGSFYLNHEKKLQFTPNPQGNFLISSFGLKPVTAVPVSKKKQGIISVKDHKPVTGTPSVAGYISIAAVIALLIASVYLFPKFEMDLASLAGLWTNETAMEQKVTPVAEPVVEESKEIIAPPSINNDETEPIAKTETEKRDEVTVSEPTVIEEPLPPVPEEEKIQMPYHVIAGCFKVEENAIKLVQQLRAQGLPAAGIGKSKSGLTMVSAGGFSTAAEARMKLEELKSVLPDGGWVYHSSAVE